jgi:GT2 family glycosyltransferase
MKYSVIFMCYNQKHMFDTYEKSVVKHNVEIIISDDGSTDGSKEEARKRGWTVVGNPINRGFDIITGANEAAKVAKGEYLIYFTGDTYPKEDYIDKTDEHILEKTILNGMRLQVKNGKIIANDWRYLKTQSWDWDNVIDLQTKISDPWEFMQSNGMMLAKKVYNDLGGMFEGYKHHVGACDTDLMAHAFFKGYKLLIVPDAICYHEHHKENFDDEYSQKLKADRIAMFKEEYSQ